MSRKYTPRRAGSRWLQDAPAYVLDVLDNGGRTCDRYTVIFGGDLMVCGRLQYLGLSENPSHPQGFSQWGELGVLEASGYRRANARHRIRWQDLPEPVRREIRFRVEETQA